MSLPPPDPKGTILITGASAGIGAELARQLAARGHGLTLVARRRERLKELKGELEPRSGVRVDVHATDLSSTAARRRLIARLEAGERHIYGLCNNAGFGSFGRFWELPLERETEQVRLNVEAVHELCGAFLPPMVERGAGAVLNVGSLAGGQPQPSNATYAATKAFVNSFSEALHAELSGTGVSCTVLTPGPVETGFADVAGQGHRNGAGPRFIWATAEQAARSGIEGMESGRRVVAPRLGDKAVGALGRFAPRAVLLPVTQLVASRTLDR